MTSFASVAVSNDGQVFHHFLLRNGFTEYRTEGAWRWFEYPQAMKTRVHVQFKTDARLGELQAVIWVGDGAKVGSEAMTFGLSESKEAVNRALDAFSARGGKFSGIESEGAEIERALRIDSTVGSLMDSGFELIDERGDFVGAGVWARTWTRSDVTVRVGETTRILWRDYTGKVLHRVEFPNFVEFEPSVQKELKWTVHAADRYDETGNAARPRKAMLSGFGDSQVVKKCGCGRTYGAEEWKELPLVGRQHIEEDETGPGYTLELRNCTTNAGGRGCDSTIAIEIPD